MQVLREAGVRGQVPDLHPRVHVVVDVIILQHSVAIVIEVHPHLNQHRNKAHYKNDTNNADNPSMLHNMTQELL